MTARLLIPALALAVGVVLGGFLPPLSGVLRGALASVGLVQPGQAAQDTAAKPAGATPVDAHGHGAGAGHAEEAGEGKIKMSEAQVASASIGVAPAAGGRLARRLSVPGSVVPDADRVARVPARVSGSVAELRKRLGDVVAKGEVVAVLDSREVADAKAEYRAAALTSELQQGLLERERKLVEGAITTQKQFLTARTSAEEARIKVELARQKLATLGVAGPEVDALPKASPEALRRHEVRAPIAGRVIERKVDLGASVGQDAELFVLADLSKVWVEAAVPPADVGSVAEGQAVAIVPAEASGVVGAGRVIFISPVLDKDTRAARIVAEVDNAAGAWRPGSFVTAEITVEETGVDLMVPRAALQTIGTETVVFVRTPEGFEKRDVALGKGDALSVEVVFGLDAGEAVAVANSFVLKAELGKAEAEHSH